MSKVRFNLKNAALLSMEMQRGVVGDLSPGKALVEAVERNKVIPKLAALMDTAREVGATVCHLQALFREDFKGSARNAPILGALTKDTSNIREGSPGAAIMPALGPKPSDIVFPRYHGMTPFSGTSLDVTLRNLGVDTVVATGVSVNIGVMGLCLEAMNIGYRVVLARDCVAGVPDEYVDAVIKNTLSLVCSVSDSVEIAALWREHARAA
jgi:nicotinamidase-related amidase